MMLDSVSIGLFGTSLLDDTIIQFNPTARIVDPGDGGLPFLVVDRFINVRDGATGDLTGQINLNVINPGLPDSAQILLQPLSGGGFLAIYVFTDEAEVPDGFVPGTLVQEFTAGGVPVDADPVRIGDGVFGGVINRQDGGFIISQGVGVPKIEGFSATAVAVSPSGVVETVSDVSEAPVIGLGIELDDGTLFVGDSGAARLDFSPLPATMSVFDANLVLVGSFTVDDLPGGVQGANFFPMQMTRLPGTGQFVMLFVEDVTSTTGTPRMFIAFGDAIGTTTLSGLSPLIAISDNAMATAQIWPFDDGTFVLGWQEGSGLEEDPASIVWRHIDGAGSFLGPIQQVNSSRPHELLGAIDALTGDGEFSITATVLIPTQVTILGTVVDAEEPVTEQFDFNIALADNRAVLGDANDSFTGDEENEFIDGAGGDDTVAAAGGADTVLGGAGNDLVDGGDGNDVVDGGLDADVLIGGAGDDQLFGGDGNDIFSGGVGADTIDGGAGTLDIAAYADAGSGIVVDLVGDASAGEFANDVVLEVEGYQGARDFENMFLGADGADIFLGGFQRDHMTGGDGTDVLFGDRGDDTIDGGAGADIIQGGRGADVLSGGGTDGAQDVFVFELNHDANTITDFQIGEDVILVQRSGLSVEDFSFEESSGDVLISLDAGSTIIQVTGLSEADLAGSIFFV